MDEKLQLLKDRLKAITSTVKRQGRNYLTESEDREFRAIHAQVTELESEMRRAGRFDPDIVAIKRATSRGGQDWASRAATAIRKMGGENRAVTSGSIDLPTLVEPNVVAKARPQRLLDLLINRKSISSNSFSFYQQTVRTNNADVVADEATKPTSVFTVAEVNDRARVVAHLSEPVPIRLLADHEELRMWLDSEMREGVLDALESQIISGSGTGEDMTGILVAAGTTAVPFDTNIWTTLRSALTAAQVAGERPTAWVVSPQDAATLDLTLETSGSGFLLDGVNASNAGSGNVFGDTLPRVVSPSVPTGTAILADWSRLRLYVREDVRVDIDASGPDLFDKNLVKMRAEGRFNIGILRPSAFFVCDLTA
ncbi:phage major capsid protein [Mycolicibacterium elephantis]